MIGRISRAVLVAIILLSILCWVRASPASSTTTTTTNISSKDHRYRPKSYVPLLAAKLWPNDNPSETYKYSQFRFCQPPRETTRSQDLGKDMSGVRTIELLGYRLLFAVNVKMADVCGRVELSSKDLAHFRKAVKQSFVLLLYYDDLPMKIPIGHQDANGKLYLHTHWHFAVQYNGDQIIEVDVIPDESKSTELRSGEGKQNIQFSYSATWTPTSKEFSTRMNKYLDNAANSGDLGIQWFSILNSVVLVLVLTGFLAFILMRILKRDYESYLSRDLEDDREESGWKLLHGDVFRFPKHINLLSAILGNGAQLLSLSVLFLTLAMVGAFYPDYSYSSMYTAIVIIYVLTSGISGYVSQTYYLRFGGDKWVYNVLLTVLLFALPMFLVWALNNTIAIFYQSTVAFPFKTIAGILVLYVAVSFPLQLIGAITAKNYGNNNFNAPCRSRLVPRQVPPAPWWASGTILVLISGFLPFAAIYIEMSYIFLSLWGSLRYAPYPIIFIVFIILIMVTSCVSISMTYMQLSHHENHHWWWRSVWYGGSSGIFIFAYAIYFYLFETNMHGILQTSFFIGANLIISFAFFLMMSSVGFLSSLAFVKRIFSAIRVD